MINKVPDLISLMDKQDLNNYIKKVVDFSFEANKYFNDHKPWELKDSNKAVFENVLYVTADIIKQIGVMIYPIMPDTSKKILNFFLINEKNISLESLKINIENKNINNIKPLFPRVE